MSLPADPGPHVVRSLSDPIDVSMQVALSVPLFNYQWRLARVPRCYKYVVVVLMG